MYIYKYIYIHIYMYVYEPRKAEAQVSERQEPLKSVDYGGLTSVDYVGLKLTDYVGLRALLKRLVSTAAERRGNTYFAEVCSGSEGGSYLRLIDLYITQL